MTLEQEEKLVQYLIREFEVAIRLMQRDKSAAHMFDVGSDPDGVQYSMLIMMEAKDVLEEKVGKFIPSKPLTET